MYLKDSDEDFKYLNNLKGKKILLKGNHDYWWTTIKKMKEFLEENNFKDIDFLYNNSFEFENNIIVGTRGWAISEDKEDIRLFKRESLRLELSIKDGIEKFGDNKEIICFMHYPPITRQNILNNELNDLVRIMMKYNIKKCYYGHLHGESIKEAVEGNYFGIDFKLVSADATDFKLVEVL